MNQSITLQTYIRNLLFLGILFILLPIFFGNFAQSTLSSYISSVICFFILTVTGVKLVLKEFRYVKFYALAYVIQVCLGLVHYLYFVDSRYFLSVGDASGSFWHEYLSVFDAVGRLQDDRNSNGVFYWMSADEFQVTHSEIWHFISYPFYYLQHKWLNYAPLNIFSTLLVSANIMLLYKCSYAQHNETHKPLLFWTAFFPSFLLNDTVWRDPFGILLMSIGVVSVTLSKSSLSRALAFVLFGIFSFIQRTMYIVIAGVSTFWGSIVNTKSSIGKVLYFIIGFVLLFVLKDVAEDANGSEYAAGYVNIMSYLALPIKIIFGMIGPFPWTQFSTLVGRNPAFAWQLQDYIMGTFQFGFLLSIIFQWKNLSFKNLDTITVLGFGIMLSGFLSKQMHIGYISEGVLFTLPWYFSQLGTKYRKYIRLSFFILVGLNILLMTMGNLSIGSLWK